MKLTNFPILIPAFTAQIAINDPLIITSNLLNIPFVPKAGTLVSEPGYELPLEATFIQGGDFIRRDPDGQWVKLEVTSVARDTSGSLLRFSYNGVVNMAGDEGKVIRGDTNATTTGFGNAFVQIRFETDAPGLKLLQDKLYVGSGRFVIEEDRPVIVEYKISEFSESICVWGPRNKPHIDRSRFLLRMSTTCRVPLIVKLPLKLQVVAPELQSAALLQLQVYALSCGPI
ncbi:hypothetical protein FNAPI_12165 [Fusarium napiforme]|uniref:Uncharacterized protein n=1 Tax=Fusarium napiforme TaxID=42672 RepID=A0A8H5IFI5_9HYPO|nr:hypothetical protein FNAPI_12165 [Fusarium napiforme]